MSLPPFRRSLRLQLIAILAIALTPLLALSIIQGALEFEDERSRQLESLQAASALATEELDAALERALAIAAAIDEGAFPGAINGSCRETLARIAATDALITTISVRDASSRLVCSGLPETVAAQTDDRDYFERLRAGEQTAVSRIVMGRISERPVLIAGRRRETSDGRFAGSINIGIDVRETARTARSRDIAPGARLALWNPAAVFPLDVTDTQSLPFTALPGSVIDDVRASREPRIYTNAGFANGETVIISPLVGGEIGTVLIAPDGLHYSGWSGFDLVGTILIPFLMWALAIVCVWIAIDRFVLRWLTYLRRVARLYGDGRLNIAPRRARRAPAEVEELAETLARMATSLREQRTELENAIDQRTALLREIHHRVKNNLQVIVSLLNLQAGRLPDGPGRQALFEARRRINALALVHRSLYEAEDLRRVEMKPFLRELLHYVSDASQSYEQAVRVEVQSDDMEMEPDYAVPLALFVTEAANNAFKHAFEDRSTGTIRVVLQCLEGRRCEVAVEDDGSGLAEDSAEGTGSTLMSAFAQQLEGEIVRGRTESGGTRVAIRFEYEPVMIDGDDDDLL